MDCRQRVEKGITWLNGMLEFDWWNRIDLEKLDIADSTTCVLGQLAEVLLDDPAITVWGGPSFSDVILHCFPEDPDVIIECGFEALDAEPGEETIVGKSVKEYKELQNEWTKTIKDLQTLAP